MEYARSWRWVPVPPKAPYPSSPLRELCQCQLLLGADVSAPFDRFASRSDPVTSAHIASRRTNPFRDDLTAAVFLNFAVPSIKADPMLAVYAI